MTQHSTQTTSVLSSTSRRGRLPKRSWPVRLVLVAALLLAVPFLFHAGATVHAADNEITGVTVTSLNPGELAITWDAPSRAPTDYRVTWKKSDGKWPSYKNDNTVEGGNAFPAGTSHTVTDLEEGAAYKVRVRARYYDGNDNLTESGPWSDPPVEITVSSTPSKDGEGDSNEGRSTSVPAKPTGISYGASYNNVLLLWTDPGDDSITGYQILRGPDADSLAVLTEDTGSTDASYSDDTVEAETTYAYAIRARNANGLSPQSDAATANTPAAPVEPEIALAVAGVEFIIAGQTLDTTGTCIETDITMIADECTENITNPMPQFGVVGTLDGNDLVQVSIGRNLAGVALVADESDLQGANARITPTFQPGRNLLRVWGDEDGDSGSGQTHSFRINVVPYWEWNGNTLSKDSDCRDTTANAPTVDDITDDDCIVTQFGNTAELRFFNVIQEHFNVYVEVNGTNVISEPSTTDLGSSFTVNLDAVYNLIRIRLAAKGGQPTAESYDSDSFYYKVMTTDFLVSNLGQTGAVARLTTEIQAATQFTTGSNPNGYTVDKVRLPISIEAASVTPVVAIYSDVSGSPGAPIKTLTNPSITVSSSTAPEAEFDADDYKLNASTPYWIVVENADTSNSMRVSVTEQDSEDAGGAPGWSIGNVSKNRGTGGTFSDLRNSRVMQIGIKGELVTVSTDATLSNLELYPSGRSPLAPLSPTFASETTEYTARVANEHTTVNIDATRNDDNATIEFLDKDDTTIPTVGTTTNTSWIVPSLDVGDNIFKIKVTAEDTTTTKTYQVTITRSEPAVTTAPDAPASLSASAGDTEVDLTWTAPASDGGAAITKYQYRVSTVFGSTWAPDWTDVPDGSDTGTDLADERTVTVTGLANGTLHTFEVRAVNSEGDGAAAQTTATPVAVPDAPASLTATPGNTQVALAWTPPASDGGDPITKYQYRVSVDGGSTWAPDWTDVPDGSDTGTDQADERTLTITSLTNGTVHTFQVRAVNSIGNGGEAMATATPATGPAPPGAPATLTATPGDAQVTLTWTAPTSDGGMAITKYQYRVSVDGGTTWSPDWTDVPDGPDTGTDLADERALTLTGLEAVILHTFQVRDADGNHHPGGRFHQHRPRAARGDLHPDAGGIHRAGRRRDPDGRERHRGLRRLCQRPDRDPHLPGGRRHRGVRGAHFLDQIQPGRQLCSHGAGGSGIRRQRGDRDGRGRFPHRPDRGQPRPDELRRDRGWRSHVQHRLQRPGGDCCTEQRPHRHSVGHSRFGDSSCQ